MLETVKEYFSFSRKERIGIFVLMAIILGVGFAPAFFSPADDVSDSLDVHEFTNQITALDKKLVDPTKRFPENRDKTGDKIIKEYQSFGNKAEEPDTRNTVLFNFDPNTLDTDGWRRLGVKERTALTISKYRDKGGKFRKAEDILKIYGLSESDKNRLLPFVKIPFTKEPVGIPGERRDTGETASRYKPNFIYSNSIYSKKTAKIIDINSADSSEWKTLPGIGDVLSGRIIKYRDKLGGFYKVDQVAEVYGLADSTYMKIRPYLKCDSSVRKISLNEVTPGVLEQHPYLKRQIARAIVDYRVQHGLFKDLGELKNLVLITTELYEKISPYLVL